MIADTSNARRRLDPRFANRWLVGKGLNIGVEVDPTLKELWPKITAVDSITAGSGGRVAQYLTEVPSDSYDFVHAPRVLQLCQDPKIALLNWVRVLRPGGFIVALVPEELLYELGRWPSRFDAENRSSFTMRYVSQIPTSVNLVQALWKLKVDVEHLSLLSDLWRRDLVPTDQTQSGAECAIEFVVRKLPAEGEECW